MDLTALKAIVVLLVAATSIASIWRLSPADGSSGGVQQPSYRGDVQEVVYRGAVLEMVPFVNAELKPVENMLENVRIMSDYGQQAKEQGADIIVFPEYAMYTDAPKDRANFLPYTQYVPDPSLMEYPCGWDKPFNHDEVVRNLSCIAKSLEMYLVVNMPERVDCNPDQDQNCPEDHYYFYNMNVVLDRYGVVISKWRKLHLFREPYFNVGNTPDEEAIFTTDFGVRFTQHICFDSLFYRPTLSNVEKYGVRDVVMPTSWVDYLPFVSAPQSQYGFSRGVGVNLLVAGRHRPQFAAVGSGIYTGAKDITKSINVYDDTQGTKLLVRAVQTHALSKDIRATHPRPPVLPPLEFQSEGQISIAKVSQHHYFFSEDVKVFIAEQIPRVSSGSLTGYYYGPTGKALEYSLDWSLEGDGEYYLLFNSGSTGLEGHKLYRQVGGLVYCPDGLESCGKMPFSKQSRTTFHRLNLTAQFETRHLYPSVIDQDFALVSEDKWTYTTTADGDIETASMSIKEPLDFLFVASINGRVFDKDPFCEVNVC